MLRPIVTHRFLLNRVASEATPDDLEIARDLEDTLVFRRADCVGMAANMIGHNKAIICVLDERERPLLMLNPTIEGQWDRYETEEGCLSLPGERPCVRYKRIRVTWQDTTFASHTATFTGRVAEAIQHECDHLEGKII